MYVEPDCNVTVQVTVPGVAVTPVCMLTPGPMRWKLCAARVSVTAISYVPGASDVTGLPAPSSSVISKLALTEPKSVGCAEALARCGPTAAGISTTSAVTSATAARSSVLPIVVSYGPSLQADFRMGTAGGACRPAGRARATG